MNYFVTGGTGFIGRFLIDRLVERDDACIYVLTRQGSETKFDALQDRAHKSVKNRIKMVTGDITKANLGLDTQWLAAHIDQIDHFYHLAAIYDMKADAESQETANVVGTRQAVETAVHLKVKQFHHVSSIAAAGLFDGTFYEDMFDEAENMDNPYLRTKHVSEKVVRDECSVPFRIYRPGMVVGHSKTGEIDKVDGPYYFFKLLKKIRDTLPAWMPIIGVEGRHLNIVPVDYVADAIDHISHKADVHSNCFHLVDPKPFKVGEVMNIFATAGNAPKTAFRIDSRLINFLPSAVRQAIGQLPPVQQVLGGILGDLGIPKDVLSFLTYPTSFDNRETARALEGSNITVPRLNEYAPAVWDYWERNLNNDIVNDTTLKGNVAGKTVIITGASSGIGEATALKLAPTGAKLILVARDITKLEATQAQITELGGEAHIYSCDISDMESCDVLVKAVLEAHGPIDVLINNAGRSIRRSIDLSFDRFHDYERTMQLNYFGSIRLIMGFAPAMLERKAGHVINISSIGVLTNSPRFSAYVSSKAALDAFTRCAASEFSDRNVSMTTINMPLVRTPMIGPTKVYDNVPTLAPSEAADLIAQAIIRKPKRIATKVGVFSEVLHALFPKISEIIMNTGYRMFNDSAAAKGETEDKDKPTQANTEQMAFAAIMRGVHW
jgi:NAD(P)-dependent dehydrogenase (short-subunit alcohol dehydrogenase family)